MQLTGVSKAAGELERFYANGTPAERWAARPPACCVYLGTALTHSLNPRRGCRAAASGFAHLPWHCLCGSLSSDLSELTA